MAFPNDGAAPLSAFDRSKNVLDSVERAGLPDFQRRDAIRIAGQLPTLFPGATGIMASYGYSVLYPQGIVLDEKAGQVLTLYNPDEGGSNTWCWVEVRTWPDLEFVMFFSAGGAFNEGAVVHYADGVRYLDLGEGSGTNLIGRYDITDPTPGVRMAPVSTHEVPYKVQLSGWRDVRLVESSETPVGVRRKYIHNITDADYAITGTLRFDLSDTGNDPDNIAGTDGTAAFDITTQFPKSQGTALAGGYIFHMIGGFWNASAETPEGFSLQGVKVFDLQGHKVSEVLVPAPDLAAIFSASGVASSRIETEGGFVSSEGRIFTLCMVRSGAGSNASITGRVLVEWFAKGQGVVDIRSILVSPMGSATFKNGRILTSRNPATGAVFGSFTDVLDYMAATDETFVQFAAAKWPDIKDLNGAAWPQFSIVEVVMLDSWSWRITARNLTQEVEYQISGNPRVQTQRVVRDGGSFSPTLRIGGSTSGITYSASRRGLWRRVGGVVTVQMIIELTSKGSQAGNLTIDLPVNPANSDGSGGAVVQSFAGLTSSVGLVPFAAGNVQLYHNGPTGREALTEANLTNSSVIRAAFSYICE